MNLFQERFSPMLLVSQNNAFSSKDYLFEIKFDGMRAFIYVSKDEFYIFNRHKKDITYLFPELKSIQKCISVPTILDGEIVSFLNGVPSFRELQKRTHLKNKIKIDAMANLNAVMFVSFDILYYGKDLTYMPLLKRKKILDSISFPEEYIKSMYILENGISFFKKIKSLGLEGMVAKKIDSSYLINTRSDDWIKIKNLKEDVFFIGGFIDKCTSNVFSLLLGEYKNNEFRYVGKVSVSKKNSLYESLLNERKLKKSPFYEEHMEAIFVKPKYRCVVRYLEKTEDGLLRQPVFIKKKS